MLMINIYIFRYIFTFVQSAWCCWSSCYLYEHPEELTEMEVVPEQSESRTAVLWKHRAAVSWHQETDLQTNREESGHKCVHQQNEEKKNQNSANANGDISTALARPPAPAGSLSMHLRWPVACYRAAAFFKGGETRCRRNGGIWLYRPVTSPHNRPCRRQQNKAFKSINNTDKYVHLPSSHRLRDLYNCVGWILARISEKASAESQQGSV